LIPDGEESLADAEPAGGRSRAASRMRIRARRGLSRDRATDRSTLAANGERVLCAAAGPGAAGYSISRMTTRTSRRRGSSERSTARTSGARNRAIEAQAGVSAVRVSDVADSFPARTCGADFSPRIR